MAPTRAPYDPVKALEGMFYGSVTRIAYAIKDPVNFAAPTNTVLTECAKRFHDALDDCEIQLLDAKWYLENQLAENKARREAKAREMGTAIKRKHEEIQEAGDPPAIEETPSKRSKIEPPKQEQSPQAKDQSQPQANPALQTQPKVNSQPKATPESKPQADKMESLPPISDSTNPFFIEQPKQEPPLDSKDDSAIQLSQDDFAKPTPQATPAGTNDDFNFESMFGDPANDPDTHKEDDLNFDLGLDGTFGDTTDTNNNIDTNEINNTTHDPSSLDSLLPGLETYAHQPGENVNPMDNIKTNNIITSGMNVTSSAAAAGIGPDATNNFSNEFDLPEMGGSNDFDDFLNDDSLGAGTYDGNADLAGEDFLDMTLDDSFFA